MRKKLWGYRIHGVRAAAYNLHSKGLAETYHVNIRKVQVLWQILVSLIRFFCRILERFV